MLLWTKVLEHYCGKWSLALFFTTWTSLYAKKFAVFFRVTLNCELM